MNQFDMFPPKTIIEIAHAHAELLSTEFLIWLPDNLPVWQRFEEEALKIIAAGFQHYSSYTIVEFIRHHTALSENGMYKINNNYRPYLSRLFDAAHPLKAGLFEYRVTTKEKGTTHDSK